MSLFLDRFPFTLLFLFRCRFRFRLRFRFLFPFPFLFRNPVSGFSRSPLPVQILRYQALPKASNQYSHPLVLLCHSIPVQDEHWIFQWHRSNTELEICISIWARGLVLSTAIINLSFVVCSISNILL